MLILIFLIVAFLCALVFHLPNVWQRLMADYHRDQLFRLRSEVREYFLDSNYGLEHPAYLNLRRLINSYLRYLEKHSFSSVLAIAYFCKSYTCFARI